MGREKQAIEIIVWCEPREHEEDERMLDTLKTYVRNAVSDTLKDHPSYFIDTMGLE